VERGERSRAGALLMRAGERGHPSALLGVAELFERGPLTTGGAAPAFGWYQKAAARGQPEGMRRLGWCLAFGVGVSGDKG
jgi:TPR repeat protein